jgi:hypothetical protein
LINGYKNSLQKSQKWRKEKNKSTNELLVDDPRNLFFYPKHFEIARQRYTYVASPFWISTHICACFVQRAFEEDGKKTKKKGKQHKTIKSSRKKRFEIIFCLGCE